MIGIIHALAGLILGVITSLPITACIIGSLIPDIDLILPVEHRTLTHSLLFVFLVSTSYYLISKDKHNSLGLLVGILSHLVLDLFSPVGLTLFYPLMTYYSIGDFFG